MLGAHLHKITAWGNARRDQNICENDLYLEARLTWVYLAYTQLHTHGHAREVHNIMHARFKFNLANKLLLLCCCWSRRCEDLSRYQQYYSAISISRGVTGVHDVSMQPCTCQGVCMLPPPRACRSRLPPLCRRAGSVYNVAPFCAVGGWARSLYTMHALWPA